MKIFEFEIIWFFQKFTDTRWRRKKIFFSLFGSPSAYEGWHKKWGQRWTKIVKKYFIFEKFEKIFPIEFLYYLFFFAPRYFTPINKTPLFNDWKRTFLEHQISVIHKIWHEIRIPHPSFTRKPVKTLFYCMEVPKTGNVLFLEHQISVIHQIWH